MDGIAPKTEAELIKYLIARGYDKDRAEEIAAIQYGRSQGDVILLSKDDTAEG